MKQLGDNATGVVFIIIDVPYHFLADQQVRYLHTLIEEID